MVRKENLISRAGAVVRAGYLVLSVFFILATDLYGQDFYDIDSINTIDLIFAESNWDHILDSLYAVGEDRMAGT
ncbi:MAG: hypothetical protein ACOYVF_05725, partial [Candidatus Zixiibacteriota bacterium]